MVAVGPLDVPVEQWLAPRAGVPEWVEVIDRADHGRVVTVRGVWRRGSPCVTTTFDDAGRALVSRYGDGHPDERYVYDTAGRLIAIEESTGFASITPPDWRDEDPIGGRLDVVYDDRGVRSVQREDSGLNIWERLDQPWPDARTGFAQQLTQASIAGMAEECRRARHDPSDEVFSLALVPYPSALSQLRPALFAGREQDRQRLIANPDEDLEEYLWWG